MKRISFTIVILISLVMSGAGQASKDSISQLKNKILTTGNDTNLIKIYNALSSGYRFSNIDSSLYYSDLAIALSEKLKWPLAKASFLSLKGATVLEIGEIPQSLTYQFQALKIAQNQPDAEEAKLPGTTGIILNRIGNVYMELANYKKAIEYYKLSIEEFENTNEIKGIPNSLSNIGNVYELMGIADSAIYYQQMTYDSALKRMNRTDIVRGEMMFRMGNAYKLIGDNDKALYYYKKGIEESLFDNDLRNLAMNNLFISKLYFDNNNYDSSLKYAEQAMQIGKKVTFRKGIYETTLLISKIYCANKDYEKAYQYLALSDIQRDSLAGAKKFQDLQRIILSEQERRQIEDEQRIAEDNRRKQILLLAGSGVLLLIAFIFFRNNRHKQKANKVLQKTLSNLKSTQSQLIQSEKMASLGELTAGIAHEIQNPLNFVNNFSEVNKELLSEMNEEIEKGNLDEVKAIAKDVIDNEEKINHHGKRADAIVKGMLQHSRSSTGQKEPTAINALADEYLGLAYHGLRAKDKSFNATMKTEYEEGLGKVNVIPQDIGRVILNLITNAFYVVNEREKLLANSHQLTAGEYKPTVTVSTKKLNNMVEIRVADNGNGIPPKVLDKIFQPFFTTKPTGQGTGLGLSLSYDIVKAHGGELKVATTEGKGSEFVIQLPVV